MPKIGISGFGSVGNLILRIAFEAGLSVVAINEPSISIECMVHQIRFSKTHGIFDGTVTEESGFLVVNDKVIAVFTETEAKNIPWNSVGAEYIVDTTGSITSEENASHHLLGGAKKVIVAGSTEDIPIIIQGINSDVYNSELNIISTSSPAVNCAVPIIKHLNDKFEVKIGCIMTVRSHFGSDIGNPTEGNIVPTNTNDVDDICKLIPDMDHKLTGLSYDVSLKNVCVVALNIQMDQEYEYQEIVSSVKKACNEEYTGLVDFYAISAPASINLNKHSCIFAAGAGKRLNNNFFKFHLSYNGYWGYANRIVELIQFMKLSDT